MLCIRNRPKGLANRLSAAYLLGGLLSFSTAQAERGFVLLAFEQILFAGDIGFRGLIIQDFFQWPTFFEFGLGRILLFGVA